MHSSNDMKYRDLNRKQIYGTNHVLNVRLYAFGQAREMIVQNFMIIPAGCCLEELISILKSKFPALDDLQFRVAINEIFQDHNYQLQNNDEVAILPSFSGG